MGNVDDSRDGKNLESTFRGFITNQVSTPKHETDLAKEMWPKVVAHLKEGLGESFAGSFLSGSYARKVQVRRLKDVDIIVELHDADGNFRASAKATLQRLAHELADFPGLAEPPEIGIRAVTLYFEDFDFKIDVVPAIPTSGERHLLTVNDPGEGKNEWSVASPKLQRSAAVKKNAALDGNYTPGTKLVKEWNQRLGDGKLKVMPSYLAESILFHAVPSWTSFEVTVVAFFEAAVGHLSIPSPTVSCPGDKFNFVDEKLEDARRERALSLATVALRQSKAALSEPDPDHSLDLWAEIFTSIDFPAPKNSPTRIANALGSGGVSASGPSIAAGAAGRGVTNNRSWQQ